MTRRDPAVSVTFGRGEDSPTYVTGPAGSFLVAHNGSDYSLFTWTEAAGAGAEVGTGEYPKLLERAKKWARLARLAPSWDAHDHEDEGEDRTARWNRALGYDQPLPRRDY